MCTIADLLQGGYPGQSGGAALLDIITGSRAPAGRLVSTQYPADYVDEFYQLDMGLAPNASTGNPGQTYAWYTGEAVYPFGHGLFYTTFEEKSTMASAASGYGNSTTSYNITDIFANPHVGYGYAEQIPVLNFTFSVTNTGNASSDYSAMLFVSTTSGPTPRPIKWLVGIDREASIAPGGVTQVSIPVPIGALARADITGDLVIFPGDYSLMLNNEASVVYNFTITGTAVTTQKWPEYAQEIPPA